VLEDHRTIHASTVSQNAMQTAHLPAEREIVRTVSHRFLDELELQAFHCGSPSSVAIWNSGRLLSASTTRFSASGLVFSRNVFVSWKRPASCTAELAEQEASLATRPKRIRLLLPSTTRKAE
jgi:hypothetical protein